MFTQAHIHNARLAKLYTFGNTGGAGGVNLPCGIVKTAIGVRVAAIGAVVPLPKGVLLALTSDHINARDIEVDHAASAVPEVLKAILDDGQGRLGVVEDAGSFSARQAPVHGNE